MSAQRGTETLYLVDAYALLFQVFHAIREMTSPRGFPTNALFGFTRDMLFLHEEKKPDYLVAVFDGEQKTFRDEIFADYKANRGPMPDTLRQQLPGVRELLEAMRIPALVVEGYEADDVIATLAVRSAERGMEVYICSSDKDCRQLITDTVRMYNLRKHALLDRAELLKDWGIRPDQVVDFQTLVGDSVDNVQGVPGIGPKTAAKLLQQYETLDNLVANADQLTGKVKENFKASIPHLETTRKLVRLDCAVPINLDWEAWRRQSMNGPKLLELFRDWGFHRFADQVQAAVGGGDHSSLRQSSAKPPPPPAPSFSADDSLFGAEAEPADSPVAVLDTEPTPTAEATPSAPTKRQWQADYQLVDTPAKFDKFVKALGRQRRFAVDLETTGLEPRRAEIVGLAFSWQEGTGWYLPVRGPAECALLEPRQTLENLRPILEDAAIEKTNQNIKYDLLVFRQQGITVRGVTGDPMIADYLLNAGERSHSIETLARTYLQHEVIPITDLIGKKGPKQKNMAEVPTHRIAEYSGEDADVAWRLTALLEENLRGENLKTLYDELEIPLIEVLAELEFNGIRLDVPRLRELGTKLGNEISRIEQEIYQIAGEEFNIASLKQLRRILFDKLNLPIRKKTGITGEASTNQVVLEQLAADGLEFPKLLLEHRRLSKLKGTYIDTLPDLVNPDTLRIHASFQQAVAATGRLSSSDPNLQNIPIRSELGGQIRQAFVPEPGWVLVTADYSQIELRLLAHFAQDPVLQSAFHDDRDVHSLVASQIYGVSEEQVSADMRRMAKTVNFGVIYGMSAHGLAQRLQITRTEADAFITAYFARYPRVLEYQDRLLRQCREKGYVSTLLGRRRSFQGEVIRAGSTYQQRNTAEREAINMEIQGSAADLIKVAMLNVYRRLKQENQHTRMLLQIHDELVFEAPPEELQTSARLIAEEMNTALAGKLTVPLKVDVCAGSNWLDVQTTML